MFVKFRSRRNKINKDARGASQKRIYLGKDIRRK